MAEHLTPGVYIEEQVATGPIVGVGTSTAAFLGVAGIGPMAEPTRVTNLTTFMSTFVPDRKTLDAENANLVRGVRGFFENGGTTAWVTRIGLTGVRATADLTNGDREHAVLKVTARRPGEHGNNISIEVTHERDHEENPTFTLIVSGPSQNQRESFSGLSMDPASPSFVGFAVRYAEVEVAPTDPRERSAPSETKEPVALTHGEDERPSDDDAAWKAGLAALAQIDEVSLVCAPGVTSPSIQGLLLAHCEQVTGDRFAILDAPLAADRKGVLAALHAVVSPSGYAALYHPWLTIPNPAARGETEAIPPSGHVAGVFARVDAQRGVHKAPANELITGVVGLAQSVDDTDHGELNKAGVNVLRVFPGRSRPTIWGARTTSDGTAWQHVNVRRLFLFVEESIQEGIRWAVFEPNDRALWKRLQRTISEFLTRVWSSGALFGATAEEAFFVKIDDENNPKAAQDLGQVFIDVGLAPVHPAEFIVVRIGIWAGGGEAQEG